jgi:repressor LexA
MKGLTKRQTEVLSFIKGYIRDHKFPPTVREISENFEISVRGAYDHIKALEKKQVLRCDNMRSRAMEVLDSDPADEEPTTRVPVLGTVAAGRPISSEENYEGYLSVPVGLLQNGCHFAVHVRGDSMIDAGIMEGDLAIVKEQNTADNGEIVVAMIDEAVTLKRFYKEANRIRLQSENRKYPPIYTRDLRILGKLAHIYRSY